jgi:hypothetical protein
LADGLQIQPQADLPTNANFRLPQIPHEHGSCVRCELEKISNPKEDTKCQECRVPEIIEPSSGFLGGASKTKAFLPRLDIPVQVQAVQATTSGDSLRKHSDSHLSPDPGATSRCSACELTALIDPSSSTSCPSCSFDPSCLSPISEKSPASSVRRSRAGRNSKLPVQALNRLQAWLDANVHDPYPDAETKRLLAQECGITEKQVTTWFTNARARQLSPLDSCLSSSSDDEAAKQSDIEDAATGLNYVSEARPRGRDRRATSISEASIFPNPQAQARPSRRGKKKNFRRNANPEPPQTPLLVSPNLPISPLDDIPENDPEMWQCTFCRKSLVPKSWRRHEETQHRPKAQWTCMLDGPRLSFPARSNSTSVCAFCMLKNPSGDHFLSHHRIEDCVKRDLVDRTYFRPDHLRQHVKNFHNATLFDIVQARWKKAAEAVTEGWTCGFCGDRLETWDKRETHIANHFKDGMTMASWNDYPENVPVANKKGKAKDASKQDDHVSALTRLGRHAFPRRYTRSSQSQQPFPEQTQPEPSQPSFTNTWDQIPSSLGLGITFSEPPVLPDLPLFDPLSMDCGNFLDWNLPTSTSPGMPYTLTNTSMFDPSATSLAQPFDGTLDLDIYGNAVNYQGAWGQLPPQHQNQHSNHQHQQQQ